MRGRKNKNDKTDALYVAKLALFETESALPLKFKYTKQNQLKKALKLLVKEREDILKKTTANLNRAHAMIHLFFGDDTKISSLEKNLNKNFVIVEMKELLEQKRTSLQHNMDDNTKYQSFVLEIVIVKLEEIMFLREALAKLNEKIQKIASQIKRSEETERGVVRLRNYCGVHYRLRSW